MGTRASRTRPWAEVHVRPLHDWLVVRLDPLPEKTRGGIILPTDVEMRQRTGTVLRIGPGRRRWSDVLEREYLVPNDLEPGEKVVFFREHLEHQQGKALVGVMQELEEGTGLLRVDDVLWSEGKV